MPTPRAFVIVVNATAGRGRALRKAERVLRGLGELGNSVTMERTSAAGDAAKLVRQIANQKEGQTKCVVACGGDGTLQEVAGAIAEATANTTVRIGQPGLTMGLAPAGRCNDFARALGVPVEVEGIVRILSTGQPRPIDLGRMNERYFCTVATAGIDAEVSGFVDRMRMPLSGRLAYLYGALRVLMRYQPRTMKLSGDFGVIERPLFLASSANTRSYGGAIPIAPDAVPDDGLLDLCIIDSVSRWRMLSLVPRVLRGRHRTQPEVRFIRTRTLKLESDLPLELWADGEQMGCTPVTIEIVPAALQILLPQRSPAMEPTNKSLQHGDAEISG